MFSSQREVWNYLNGHTVNENCNWKSYPSLTLVTPTPPRPLPDIEKNLSDTEEDLRLAADEGLGPPMPPPDIDDLRLVADDGRGPPRARHVEKL